MVINVVMENIVTARLLPGINYQRSIKLLFVPQYVLLALLVRVFLVHRWVEQV
jgi:hypothetical protein